jgi:hypothetical protein
MEMGLMAGTIGYIMVVESKYGLGVSEDLWINVSALQVYAKTTVQVLPSFLILAVSSKEWSMK